MPVIGECVSVSIGKILLATDFSSASEKAASYAKALARRFSSVVELVHVFDPSVVTRGLTPEFLAQATRPGNDHMLVGTRATYCLCGLDLG